MSEHPEAGRQFLRHTLATVAYRVPIVQYAPLPSAVQQLAITNLKTIKAGGSIIHEVGGAIMGADAGRSITNLWCQTSDVKNLFVTAGAVFASNADKNPTLTIMAIAWRAADHILALMRRREL